MSMELTDTFNGMELEPCGLELSHGPHSHHNGETTDTGMVEVWCEGWGIVTVSFSELDTFRQCPKKHDLAYHQRFSREHTDTSPLGLGTLWHRLLEVHYRTIKSAQVTDDRGDSLVWSVSKEDLMTGVKDAVESLLTVMETEENVSEEALRTLRWMYAGHLIEWGLDEQWDIIAVETTAVLTLHNEQGDASWVRLKVKLDLLVRDQRGHYWVVDHKSAGQLPNDKDLDWDDQFGLYVAAMRQNGIKIMGAIHSCALKKMNKGDIFKPGDDGYKASMKETEQANRFRRTPLNRTEAECLSILEDARCTAELAWGEHNHKRRYANPDTCKWRCDFKEACIYGRRTNNDGKLIEMLQLTGFTQDFTRH
jgi:hypothetical protein